MKACGLIADSPIPNEYKDYLGDGLYVRFDGFGVWVTSENGVEVLNECYFEPDVLRSFIRFCERTGMKVPA